MCVETILTIFSPHFIWFPVGKWRQTQKRFRAKKWYTVPLYNETLNTPWPSHLDSSSDVVTKPHSQKSGFSEVRFVCFVGHICAESQLLSLAHLSLLTSQDIRYLLNVESILYIFYLRISLTFWEMRLFISSQLDNKYHVFINTHLKLTI